MGKILIIEDDKSIAVLQRDYFEINGFQVEICLDGTQGLKYAQQNEYSLIILDLMLPGTDGFEILRRIRNDKDVPILVVSAKKEEVDKIRGLGLGADDYITKPFSPGELVARAKAHLSRYDRLMGRNTEAADSSASIKIGGLEIQKEAHRVFVNGKEISLAQKEFELLVFLAENPNRVFNKDTIFEKIWGLDALGDTSTVTVHIARLREKIEANPAKPQVIETVWGAGYRCRA